MFGKNRKARIAEVQEQIDAARASASRAEQVESGLVESSGWVESLVSYLEERRNQNHFGQDFTIAMTPRKRRP